MTIYSYLIQLPDGTSIRDALRPTPHHREKKMKTDWRKIRKVYNAVERASLGDDAEKRVKADMAFSKIRDRSMSAEEFMYWLSDEEDFRAMGGWDGEYVKGRRVR